MLILTLTCIWAQQNYRSYVETVYEIADFLDIFM